MQTKEATKALEATRTAIEKLIAVTNDNYALSKLGGILADLKTAQNELSQL